MVKIGTIGMLEKNLKNVPDKKAHADIQNGWIGTCKGDKTVVPTTDTVKLPDLMIALNTVVGDESYTDMPIKKDTYVNLFSLKAWAGQTLVLDASHFADSLTALAVDDILVANTVGKLVKGVATGYAVSFVVTKKLNFNGGGAEVRIIA